MFTGIVRERARVVSFDDGRLVLESSVDAGIGDSVAVDGVCLTVVSSDNGSLAFDVVPETTSHVKPFRDVVNVEPPLRAGEPLGGHIVQGHVDGLGRVRSVEPEAEGARMWIDVPRDLLRYLVQKGSVAVDGVSLTVAGLDERGFAVAIVPHTLNATTLGGRQTGDDVNVEVDVLAKYVERLVAFRS